MTQATIRAIEYHLPESVLTTEALSQMFPDWSVIKIDSKTGIQERHIAAVAECASDLAFCAAQKLFASGAVAPADIDCLLFCSQSPDYFLPATACTLQHRLKIPTECFAVDINQGCSGFVYGLGIAKALIESGQVSRVLLLTAETYSKFIHPEDRGVRTIFGDGAAATLIEAFVSDKEEPSIGPFVWGTDGSGAKNLIVPGGAMRIPDPLSNNNTFQSPDGFPRGPEHLYMNGSAVFEFTLAAVPKAFEDLLIASNKQFSDFDLFVFHQANRYMLNSLRDFLKIPEQKFQLALSNCGNTVSSTIPIALKEALNEGKLQPGSLVMLVGFGVGFSWGAGIVRWR